jgi:hypothetical protein
MKIEPFLYRNIIKDKSDNIFFEINKPKFEKIVLKLDRGYESRNGYFTILYVNNGYRLYYKACSMPYYKNKSKKLLYSTNELTPHEYFCLAVSNDGLNFEKKNLNLVSYNDSTNNNILKHDLFCHNFYPYYDKRNNRYIGLSGTHVFNDGLHLFDSNDGIKWRYVKKILCHDNVLPDWFHHNHFDTHNCIIYNEKDNYYYIYVRNNKKDRRFVQFARTKDFETFVNNDKMLDYGKYINCDDMFILIVTEDA